VILLDSNHLVVLMYPESARYASLTDRMRGSADQEFALPVVALEEQLRGWLAIIHQANQSRRQVDAYDRLVGLFEFFADWQIARFDAAAAIMFDDLRRQKLRVGTMDLRIAAIALVQDALLLSADLSDFERVPGLKVENWLA
jgi:tRNA(fMet)-specific endonuclease VapC